MTNVIPAALAEPKPQQQSNGQSRKFYSLWAFLCLALVEFAAFGINAKRVGVYQDEWIYFGNVHFVPHTFLNVLSKWFWDPRMIVRPVEAFYFGPLYFLQWEKPFWYHASCYVFEFLAGCFLYLAIVRLVRNRAVALTGAILFLLYPTHDATHYYITASAEQISATFFTLSLWLFLKGVEQERYALIFWSALAYFQSVYFYEQTLPHVLLFPMLTVLHLGREKLVAKGLKQFIVLQTPFFLVAASMILFRSWLLPALGLGWHYSTCFSLSNFISVIEAGLNVNLSPYMFSFCLSMASDQIKQGVPALSWCCLIAVTSFVALSIIFAGKQDRQLNAGEHKANSKVLALIFIGAVTLIISYTIFGFSPEHLPVLDGWRNRVNICGSLGASLIVAGLLATGRDFWLSKWKSFAQPMFALVVSILAGFFILVDWQFAKPWIVSWQSQKELMSFIAQHSGQIKSGDSIIIGGISRYVNWAPVVDGVWDFENIVRTTLNNPHVNGNVVTGRLVAEQDRLVDRSGTLILGAYPYRHMILYSPEKNQWQRISSREEFMQQAKQLGWVIASSKSSNK